MFTRTQEYLDTLPENSTSTHGHNKYSDWTTDEYQKLLGLKSK